MAREPGKWSDTDLQSLISNNEKETWELDFKDARALMQTDRCKDEISKDVSAFANAGGGVLIYGIGENPSHEADRVTPVDPKQIPIEWLSQVIGSRIHKRIEDIKIDEVAVGGGVVYVVTIPQSNRAPHQASDRKFYRRNNTTTDAMLEYEVMDVAKRQSAPNLDLSFRFDGEVEPLSIAINTPNDGEHTYSFNLFVTNESPAPATYASFHIVFDDQIPMYLTRDLKVRTVKEDRQGMTRRRTSLIRDWHVATDLPIFSRYEQPLFSEPSRLRIGKGFKFEERHEWYFGYRIYCQGAAPKVVHGKLVYGDYLVKLAWGTGE